MDAPTLRRRVAALLCAAAAAWLALDAGWIHAKAWLAQQLLQQAWERSAGDAAPQRPWPWADTHPVARLRVPELGIDQIVLAGDSGRTLAFGPGWAEASATPDARGTIVLSGHRDTHFAFLQALRTGDTIELDGAQARRRYRVASARVADTRSERVAIDGDDALLLVTCWPFDALVAGGPLRWVVRAEPAPSAAHDETPSRM
jgi:sortase A